MRIPVTQWKVPRVLLKAQTRMWLLQWVVAAAAAPSSRPSSCQKAKQSCLALTFSEDSSAGAQYSKGPFCYRSYNHR